MSSLVLKIWRPGAHPEMELLTLQDLPGLQVFLEALARGNTLFRDQCFHIQARGCDEGS